MFIDREKNLTLRWPKRSLFQQFSHFGPLKGLLSLFRPMPSLCFLQNEANAYFSKRSDFSHKNKPSKKACQQPEELWPTSSDKKTKKKNTNANYSIATQEKIQLLTTIIRLTKNYGHVAGGLGVESHIFLQNMHSLVS